MRELLSKGRRGYRLSHNIDGLSVLKPQGAFYLFINIKDYKKRLEEAKAKTGKTSSVISGSCSRYWIWS